MLPFQIAMEGLVDDLENLRLPNIELLQQWKEYQDRTLVFDFAVDEMLMTYIRYIIQWNKDDKDLPSEQRKPINLYIYSYGGDENVMFMMINILKLSKTPIRMICLGQACSAAALIFLAKTENITRYMLRDARVLIHQGETGLRGQTNAVLDIAEHIKKSEEKIKKYVLDNTLITSKMYTQKKRKEWCIDADEALKLGVCDKIVDNIDELY
jgi:ATP-dependent Clp protease protease subunit